MKYQRERVNIHQQEAPTIRDIARDNLSPTGEIGQEANRAIRADDEIEPLIQRIRQVIDVAGDETRWQAHIIRESPRD